MPHIGHGDARAVRHRCSRCSGRRCGTAALGAGLVGVLGDSGSLLGGGFRGEAAFGKLLPGRDWLLPADAPLATGAPCTRWQQRVNEGRD